MANQAYELKISFPEDLPTAGATFNYENRSNKLYTTRESTVPFKIKVTNPTSSALQVRVMAVYTDHNFRHIPVQSCTQHSWCLDSPHFVKMSGYSLKYTGKCNATLHQERLAVIKQLPEIQEITDLLELKFSCNEECHPAPNCRKIDLQFTLENMEGSILDQKNIHLQVCTLDRYRRAHAIDE